MRATDTRGGGQSPFPVLLLDKLQPGEIVQVGTTWGDEYRFDVQSVGDRVLALAERRGSRDDPARPGMPWMQFEGPVELKGSCERVMDWKIRYASGDEVTAMIPVNATLGLMALEKRFWFSGGPDGKSVYATPTLNTIRKFDRKAPEHRLFAYWLGSIRHLLNRFAEI